MAQAKGVNGQLLVDFESNYGTDPGTPAAVKLPFNTFDVQAKQNMVESNTITGTRNPVKPTRGNTDVAGSIVVPVDEVAFGYWLKALFGAGSKTGTVDPITWKYKVNSNQPSMVLEKGFTDIGQYLKYNGCKVNTLKMEFGGDADLTASIDVIGAKETLGAAPYAASPTTVTLNKFSNFQASIEEGGATIAYVTKGSFEIGANLDNTVYTVGSNGTRGNLPEGIMKVSGSITALFQDAALLNKAISGDKSSLKVKFTSDTHSLEFFFPEIVYEHASPGITGPAGVLITLPWRGFYSNDSNASAAVVTLVNGQTAY